MNQVTLQMNDTPNAQVLFVALELSDKSWTLLFGHGGRYREVVVPVGDVARVANESIKARGRFGLQADAPVLSCYEAGRDGFWVHRALEAAGITNLVMDPSSIQVDRRMRRAKTDRLDVRKLLELLIRHHRGEQAFRVVAVPSRETEDVRRDARELERLKKERTGHVNRIKSLLQLHGVRARKIPALDEVRDWQGEPLPPVILDELKREESRLELAQEQIEDIEALRRERLKEKLPSVLVQKVATLSQLRGVAGTSSWLFVGEFFAWRTFRNRRQVGSAAGLTACPYDSGWSERDQGISKAGNRRVRTMAIQLAWSWLRYQPQSALSQWFTKRFGIGKRSRRIGIVALARRLLIAFWRFVEQGVVPEGALLKAA